jgi:beta-glucosidase
MIMIDDWAEQVPAILYSWYSGMEGGTAFARILFGEVNPSGKLPFTIPTDVAHLPYFSSTDKEIEYNLYHGYTFLDKNEHKPNYPFGYGLSYTNFEFQNLEIQKLKNAVDVSVQVSNTGDRTGEETVQVYVGMENSSIERPKKLLKGFEKVTISASESIEVKISIPIDELRYYDTHKQVWQLEPGTYTFLVGSSSDENILLRGNLDLP